MSKEIRPCPFCGSKADVFFKNGWYTVECNDVCLASGPMKRDEAEAISSWNIRVPDRAAFDAGWDWHKLLFSQTKTDEDIARITAENRPKMYKASAEMLTRQARDPGVNDE